MTSKNKYSIYLGSFIVFFLCSATFSNAQNNATTSLYEWFDTQIGKENLDLNNGVILLNYDKSVNGNDRFYFDQYYSGSVKYDHQIYDNVSLNYDVLNDNLILKPYGTSDKIAIIITREKVDYFFVKEKKYVNINYAEKNTSNFIDGFFEEEPIGTNFIFYIKHKKDVSRIIKNDILIDDFTATTHYYFKYNNQFYEASSKKIFTTLFPQFKKEINGYYANNQLVEKSNTPKFFEDLFSYLNTLIK